MLHVNRLHRLFNNLAPFKYLSLRAAVDALCPGAFRRTIDEAEPPYYDSSTQQLRVIVGPALSCTCQLPSLTTLTVSKESQVTGQAVRGSDRMKDENIGTIGFCGLKMPLYPQN